MSACPTLKEAAADPGVVEDDGGLRLSGTPLWLDARRPVPLSFLSSALAFRHHQRLVTSVDTVTLLSDRLGATDALASPLGRRFSVGELVLELVPAGFMVGAASLLVEHRGCRVLYCGGLRPEPGWLGEAGQVRAVDVLVLDSQGAAGPKRLPVQRRTARELLRWTGEVLAEGDSPVLVAEALGMAQELCHLLASEGLKVRAHRAVAKWNRRVRDCGVPLARAPELRRPLGPREVAVIPPEALEALPRLAPRGRVALVSADAAELSSRQTLGAEVGFALSCHADDEALRRFVVDSGARQVYLGPHQGGRLAPSLRALGLGVTCFAPPSERSQMELFGD